MLRELMPFAAGGGGCIFALGVNLTIDKVSVLANSTASIGSGVFIGGETSTLTIAGSRFTNNTATDPLTGGGAVYAKEIQSVIVNGASLFSNRARFGAGMYLESVQSVRVLNLTALENVATNEGGVAFVDSKTGSFSVFNSTFVNNSAGAGAGCYIVNGQAQQGVQGWLNDTTAGNVAGGNTAAWGTGFVATNLTRLLPSAGALRIRSGGVLSVNMSIVDGASR